MDQATIAAMKDHAVRLKGEPYLSAATRTLASDVITLATALEEAIAAACLIYDASGKPTKLDTPELAKAYRVECARWLDRADQIIRELIDTARLTYPESAVDDLKALAKKATDWRNPGNV